MVKIWQPGADPAGYDKRLTLSGFLYDSARQADWRLRDLDVHVLPDEGLLRRIDNRATSWLVPTLAGANVLTPQGDGTISYSELEVLWTVYTAESGAEGTVVGDFPASHHSDVVGAVIAHFVGVPVFAVDPSTRELYTPPLLRGIYEEVTRFDRVDTDTQGYLQSIIRAQATAYVASDLAPVWTEGYSPVSYVGLGVSDSSWRIKYRWYNIARGEWQDDDPD